MTISSANPKRGEVWLVNLDPTIGAEIKKKRPEVVVSSDAIGILPIKLIAPVTDWNERFTSNIWHIQYLAYQDLTGQRKRPFKNLCHRYSTDQRS